MGMFFIMTYPRRWTPKGSNLNNGLYYIETDILC